MENVINNKVTMQAAAGEKKKNERSKKKKKSTRPKLRPVETLPSVDEDNLESGLGYGDIMVVPPPTPRDKLLSDLHRHEKELNSIPKFTDAWFELKQEVALVQMKLDEWDNSTPTAARMDTPIVTTSAAYQDIVKSITFKEGVSQQQQSEAAKSEETVQPPNNDNNNTKKKKKSSRKNRPKLKPQSVVEKNEEGDEEDGLGFNDFVLTKTNKPQAANVDECTSLLAMDQVVKTEVTPQEVVQSNVVGDWLVRGVIGTLFCVAAYKFVLA